MPLREMQKRGQTNWKNVLPKYLTSIEPHECDMFFNLINISAFDDYNVRGEIETSRHGCNF